MKFFKYLFGINLIACCVLLGSGVHLTSCAKQVIHDTVTVTDTLCHTEVGMIAHYTFTNGSLADESGHHNDIIFNNATPTAGRSGTGNNAFLFDGSSMFMKVANSESLNPANAISIAATVKVNGFYLGTCHASEIIGKGYPDEINGYYNLRVRDWYGDCYNVPDTTREFFTGSYGDDVPQGTAAGAASDSSHITKGQWYTVIYTYDGSASRIYVDGVLMATEKKSHTFTANGHDVFIGRHEDPAFPYWFTGVIDELRLYNRALCSCEAEQLSRLPEQANE